MQVKLLAVVVLSVVFGALNATSPHPPFHLGAVTFADGTCDDSDTKIVQNCFNIYLQFFGLSINPFPSFSNYTTVYDAYLIKRGSAGQSAICRQKNLLSLCLSSLEKDCVNFMGLSSIFGLDPESAYHYNMDYYINVIRNLGNAGLNVTMNSFYCIQAAGINQANNEQACETALLAAGHNSQSCDPYNTYIQCMATVFGNYCGSAVGSWECSGLTYGILKDVPMCQQSFTPCTTSKFLRV
uniref:DUF19 domain-containing protein n=1 Tax=Rhabditophanes sp. KR3021 TaxID=114890 RepID=A0AC35UFT5_9BILA